MTSNKESALTWDKEKTWEGMKCASSDDMLAALCVQKKMFIEAVKNHIEETGSHKLTVPKLLMLFEKTQAEAFPIYEKQLGKMFCED